MCILDVQHIDRARINCIYKSNNTRALPHTARLSTSLYILTATRWNLRVFMSTISIYRCVDTLFYPNIPTQRSYIYIESQEYNSNGRIIVCTRLYRLETMYRYILLLSIE